MGRNVVTVLAMRLHEKLDRWMAETRTSGERLAPLLDVSTMTVSRWRSGKVEPRRPELVKLATLMGVPLAWLADDDQDELVAPTQDAIDLEMLVRRLGPAEVVRRVMATPAAGELAPSAPREPARVVRIVEGPHHLDDLPPQPRRQHERADPAKTPARRKGKGRL
jgi:transcriptional regulator with XRE-family HTH domain